MKYITASLLVFFVLGLMIPNAFADSVPEWVKNTAGWWADDQVGIMVINSIHQILIRGLADFCTTYLFFYYEIHV